MSIRGKFPEQRPTLNLDFANSKKLDPHITFTRTSIGTRVSEENVLETISADDPRFDHDPTTGESLGLLIEELRTNDIRNSTMQGAESGTPGTPPTYWSMGTSYGGLTREISAVGEENGIPYIDVRFHGVATGNPTTYASFHPDGSETTNSPATKTSRYTFSSYVKRISGTVPSGCTFILVINNANSSIVDLGEYKVSTIISSSSIPSGDLIANRFALTNTDFTSTDTAYFRPYYQWNVPYNTSFDVTIRIGLPQMEEGSFATSAIPTTDQGKTRTADNVTMTGTNFTDWFNSSEGTLYASASILGKNIHTTGVEYPNGICKVSDTESDHKFSRVLYFGGNIDPERVSFGNRDSITLDNLYENNFGDIQSNQYYKVCGAYINNDEQALCLNGGIIRSNEKVINPPTPNQFLIGTGYNGAIVDAPYGDEMYLNGHISKLTYYPSRLPNDQLQSLTK